MHKLKIVVLFFLILLYYSCNRTTNKKQDIDFNYWNCLEISPEDQIISVFYDSDTARLKSWNWKDTVIKGYTRVRVKTNIKFQNFYLSKYERNLLFKYSLDLINDFQKPKNFCTEYCGHISFTLNSDQRSISANYSSICNWTKMSQTSNKIYKILSGKIKIETFSDCVP